MLLCNFKLLFVIENGHNFGESLSENEEGGLPLSINSGPIVFGIAKQQIVKPACIRHFESMLTPSPIFSNLG